MGVLKTAAFISLPLLGLCATVLYLLHKKEEDDLQDTLQDVKTSRIKTIEMKIPKSVIGVVIGRGGSNIKEVQEKTDTKINFKDQDGGEYRTCFIRGTAAAAQAAEMMLHEIITSQPLIEVRETWVPQRCTGRIIGRGGENIRAISRASNAKINVDSMSSGNVREGSGETRIVIKGTSEQIAVALSLVEEKVEEDIEFRRKMELCQANRSPRSKPKSSSHEPPIIIPEKEKKIEVSESLIATGSDGILQVFVSAVESPACFWVQVYSSRAVELDHLLEEMSEYYSLEDNRALHTLQELEIGQIVAAPFNTDNKWYRGEVKTIEVNNYNESESQVDVYYVDYGDSMYLKKNEIFELRTDFLKLRFQAIECTLANVKPYNAEKWSEKATDVFMDLCHVAEWKPLMAKVVSCDAQPRGRRGGSPVPRVSLYDTSGPEDIIVSDELVRLNFAEKEDSSQSSPGHHSQSGGSTPLLRNTTSPEPSSEADSTV